MVTHCNFLKIILYNFTKITMSHCDFNILITYPDTKHTVTVIGLTNNCYKMYDPSNQGHMPEVWGSTELLNFKKKMQLIIF